MYDPIPRLKDMIARNAVAASNGALPSCPTASYAIERFGLAFGATGQVGADEAVLLRQAVRWSGMPYLHVERPDWFDELGENFLRQAGVTWSSNGFLSAEAYAPSWLEDPPVVLDGKPIERKIDESFAAEPYLKTTVGFDRWLSPAQKEAAWIVINAQAGNTCVVGLPTGCGKSCCFWLLPYFSPGLTVVVVPTIALAMDQQRSAAERYREFPGVNPCFFASDDQADVTISRLKNRETRLVYASPETCVSGRLRPVLNEFARDGWFQNLVVDEAHLVETWGAQFRVEFQLLAAARTKWRCDSGGKLRTFLFSATMSPRCKRTLTEMFAPDQKAIEFSAQRLRPEPSYFCKEFDGEADRWRHLREALWRLPRPLILYVTRPIDADNLYHNLRKEGFRRLACFSGDTRRDERETNLRGWRENHLDLMVATSAFGVGVDKCDVRAVIHACYPENLDRYYQEVGRSGRDGFGSVCLLLPTQRDKKVAIGIGTQLLRDNAKIQQRWEAMFNARRPLEDISHGYELPINVRRLALRGNRSYTQNLIWNKSLLLQMFRAKLIEFIDLRLVNHGEDGEDPVDWISIRLRFPPGTPDIAQRLEMTRRDEMRSFELGAAQLEDIVKAGLCVSRTLKNLYGIARTQRVCGGCKYCRSHGWHGNDCPPLELPIRDQAGNGVPGAIVEEWPNPNVLNQQTRFVDAMEQLGSKYELKPLQIYCPEAHLSAVLNLLAPVFQGIRMPYRIDPFRDDISSVLGPADRPVFLHIGSYSETMLATRTIRPSTHLFCGINDTYDKNGRHIKIAYGCDSWASADAWLAQLI